MSTSTASSPGADAAPPSNSQEHDVLRVGAKHGAIAPGDIAVGVIIGRASEYFDFFVYGIASVLVFPSVFFPFEDRLQGTLYAFVVFSFAFIARPVGTVLSMMIQRRLGREA
ncbi:MAG: MFS transporter, partial [Gammaproteobacteria bacterium]|nr:MFS transporter [Gammaproteobacteria bacterium]